MNTSKPFTEKIAKFERELVNRRLSHSTYVPPIYRWIWKAGVFLPPPVFCPVWVNFLFHWISFSLLWGVAMLFFSLPSSILALVWHMGVSLVAGAAFGLFMSLIVVIQSKRHRFGSWEDY